MRYEMERRRFVLLHGEAGILKTADLIAARSWYSWVHCRKRLRVLGKQDRPSAVKLLKAAKVQRAQHGDPAEKWLHGRLDAHVEILKFFMAPLVPGVYLDRCQQILMRGQRIGITLRADRVKNDMARVYYMSRNDNVLKCTGVEIVNGSTGSEFLDSEGIKEQRTVFHVIEAKQENALLSA